MGGNSEGQSGAEQLMVKGNLLKAQGQSITMCRKLRKSGQRPARVNKVLMTELKWKKVFRSKEQGQDS